MDSERDYISIDDVVELILRISTGGSHRLYNVASGTNVSNARLVSRLADLTGCTVDVDPGASTVRFPRIDTTRITEDFGFRPHDLLDDVVDLVKQFELESGRRA
jgi:nucleoside-diphosphate-sugar epimerase